MYSHYAYLFYVNKKKETFKFLNKKDFVSIKRLYGVHADIHVKRELIRFIIGLLC